MEKRLLMLIALLVISEAYAGTYFVDYSSGSDSNAGTKSSPWKHAPGMTGFQGSYSHQAGDRIIFKGGVTWPYAAFPFDIVTSGTASSKDYYGVDKTWFTGSVWTRPIFDLGGKDAYQPVAVRSASHIEIDGIDVKGQNIAQGMTWANGGIFVYGSSDVTVRNCMLHDWTTTATNDDASNGGMMFFDSTDTIVDNCTIFSAEDNGNIGVGVRGADTVRNSVIHDVPNGIFAVTNVYSNLIYDITGSFDPSQHENGIYCFIECDIYNNIIHDIAEGTDVYLSPGWDGNSGTINFYNNVVYNSGPAAITLEPERASASSVMTVNIFQNTLACPGGSCIRQTPRDYPITYLNVKNNHYLVADGSDSWLLGIVECWNNANDNPSCGPVTHVVTEGNIKQELSAAAAQGYTQSNGFAASSASGVTVNKGVTLPAVIKDIFGTTRPQGGSWDVGAYEYGGVCAPSCVGKQCGDDGCSGSCGTCASGLTCIANQCTAVCSPNWVCGNWTACVNSQQSRVCTDDNTCGTAAGKPAESQTCTIQCIHTADISPCDGCVKQEEMMLYIQKWKAGKVTLTSLMEAIRLWKLGC